MKIEKIFYEQLYPTGIYQNQRYRIEASINEGEDLIECYRKLQSETEKAFVALNPQINWNNIPVPTSQELGIIDRKKIDETEIKIDNCTTVEELKGLEGDALKYGLVEQYINKKKLLQ